MPEPPERPVGIEGVEALYRECRQRVGDPRRQHDGELPVVVLLGRRGGGKTAVLKWLEFLASRRPHALYDFRADGAPRPHVVAQRLAFLLSHRLRGQPPVHFPRLQLGLLAVDPELSLDRSDVRRAGEQLQEALRRPGGQGQLVEQVSRAVEFLQELNLLPVPGVAFAAGLLLRGRSVLPPRAVWRTALEWYGRHHGFARLDGLVRLNALSKSPSPADAASVDEQLCRAFLADLRAAYRRGRDRNCTVLLDNVDGPGGRAFLDLLVRLREEAAVEGTGPDPLVVFAASAGTGRIPGVFPSGPRPPRVRQPEEASFRDWADARPDRPHDTSWRWYPVRLPDLTADEVSRLGARLAPRLPEATRLVHRLTYGHPWSVRLLHEAVAEIIGQGGGDPELRRILEREVDPQTLQDLRAAQGPSGARMPAGRDTVHRLGRTALEYLMQDLNDQQYRALVVCSAAREFDTASDAGLLSRSTEHTQRTLALEVRSRLWLVDPVPEDAGTRGGRGSGYLPAPSGTGGDGESRPGTGPVLHPWLRLLLLQELADLPDGDPASWGAVHEQLYGWHQDHRRPVDALYHRLALGGLDDVVHHLADRLWESSGTGEWLRELYAITAAPMRRPVLPDVSPAVRADDLARELAPHSFREHRPLAVLTAALWLATDPRNRLPDAAPELNFTISSMFLELAVTADARVAGLRHEAALYDVHA